MEQFFIVIIFVFVGIIMIILSHKLKIESSALKDKYTFRIVGLFSLLAGLYGCYLSIKCGFCDIF